MEKYFQPTWMQMVTCLNALKSDNDEYSAHNLTKISGEKQYLYAPACNSSELDCISSLPSSPAFSEPGGLHMSTKEDSSPLVKASCSLMSDVEASSHMSRGTEVTESSWILRTLHRVTFSSNYLEPYVYRGYETISRRYLYTPPSEISGFVDEGFPPCTQIHLDNEVSSLESEGLGKASCCTTAAVSQHAETHKGKSLHAEADEPPAEIIKNQGALIYDGIISEEESMCFPELTKENI